MSSLYPGALDEFVDPLGTDDTYALDHAGIHAHAHSAISAVQSALGLSPQGSAATLVLRLDDLDTLVAGKAETVHAHAIADVTSLQGTLDTKAALTGGNTFTGAQVVNTGATGVVGLVVKAFTGQTANLQEWKDSASTLLAAVLPSGAIRTTAINALTSGKAYLSTSGPTNSIVVDPNASTNIGLVVRGAASQSASLQEWQDSAAGIAAAMNPTGALRLGYAASHTARLTVGTASAAIKGIRIEAVTGQTANMLEVIDEAAVQRVSITQYGTAIFGSSTSTAGRLTVHTGTAATVGLVIRGSASQSSNLQEWQDSAASVIASLGADGIIRAQAFTPLTASAIRGTDGATMIAAGTGRNVGLATAAGSFGSGSAVVFIGNTTAAPSSNPSGGGILYVESGALKFRGSSGTVSTVAPA